MARAINVIWCRYDSILKKAFAEASKLPPEEQDFLARMLLDGLASEELWEQSFARSQDGLARLAGEALAE